MRKYEKYKSTRIEFLNEIPEHWVELRMRYIGHLYGGLSGKNANDFNSPLNMENRFFIPFTNIANNLKINPNQLQTVVIDKDECQNKVQQGDLFFLMSSENYEDVGKSSVLLTDLDETYLNSFCKGFRITKKDVDPEFLNYQLHSKQIRHNLLVGANGFTRINLKIDKVVDLLVALPTPKEQTAIATYLDQKTAEIDALITDKKRLLELYEEEKSAIINEAVTKGLASTRLASTSSAAFALGGVGSKKKNVLDESAALGGVKMKDSGIEWMGEIPANWEVKKMKVLVSKIGSGITPSGGSAVYSTNGIPLLRSQNIHFDGLKLDDVAYISEEIDKRMSNSRVMENDVLVNITGASIGRCFYVPNGFGRGNVNQHVCILRPKMECISSKYLYYLMRSIIGQEQINLQQTGANREGLNFEQLKNFHLPVPTSKSEQDFIVQYIEAETQRIDTKKEKTQKFIDLLTEYRTALISEVVTGKVKVV